MGFRDVAKSLLSLQLRALEPQLINTCLQAADILT